MACEILSSSTIKADNHKNAITRKPLPRQASTAGSKVTSRLLLLAVDEIGVAIALMSRGPHRAESI
jgi:hypothetical protein